VPVIGGPLLAACLFVAAIARAARATRLPKSEGAAAITGFALFLVVWFAGYGYLGARGIFAFNPAVSFPVLPIAVLLPLIVAVVAFQTFPALRAIADRIPQEQLIGIQIVRLMGFAFLLLLAQSLLPPVFALPAGLGDMFVGFEAIVVARLYARRAPTAPAMALLWNALGIVDFAVALAIGFLASTTPFQRIHVIPSTDLITVLPLVLVPTFGVPLFLMMHGLSLRRILAEAGAGGFARANQS
jgi:hypothetical protein